MKCTKEERHDKREYFAAYDDKIDNTQFLEKMEKTGHFIFLRLICNQCFRTNLDYQRLPGQPISNRSLGSALYLS